MYEIGDTGFQKEWSSLQILRVTDLWNRVSYSSYVSYILFKLLHYKSVKDSFICTQRNVSLVITFGLTKRQPVWLSHNCILVLLFHCLMNIDTSAEFVAGHLNLMVNVHRVSSLTFWAINSLSSKNKGFSPLICIVLNINSTIKNCTYCLNSSQVFFFSFLCSVWNDWRTFSRSGSLIQYHVLVANGNEWHLKDTYQTA